MICKNKINLIYEAEKVTFSGHFYFSFFCFKIEVFVFKFLHSGPKNVLLIWQKNEHPIVSRRCFSPLKSKIASLKIHNASKGEPSEAHAGVRCCVCEQGLICIWHQHFAFCVALALVCVRPFSLAPAFLSRTRTGASLSFSSSLVLFHQHDIKKRVSLSRAGGAVWQHSGAFPMHTLIVDTLQADLLFCTFLNVRRRP